MINSDLPSTLDSAEEKPLCPRTEHQSRVSRYVTRDVIAAVIACVGAMSMGFALGYSSPALQDAHIAAVLKDESRRTWFGSLLTIGAMVGGPVGAILVGRLGRKTTLIMCNVPLAIGWFLIIYATNVVLLYTGRYLHRSGVCTVYVYVATASTVKSLPLAALVDKPQAQIMCKKPGKTLIPIDKPQVYFVDVVKCVNEVCLQR